MSDMPPNDPGMQNPSTSLPPAGSAPVTATPAGGAVVMGETADVEKNKIFAVLAYLGILVLVPILAAKESPFARYHANQGLVLLIASIIAYVGVAIISVICTMVAPIMGCVFMVVFICLGLGLLAMVIMGIINAATGKMAPLPLIGKYKILK